MNKADLKEENPERLQEMIDEKMCELKKLLATEEETKNNLRAIEKEKERLYHLMLKYRDEMRFLNMEIEIAECEINKMTTIQKNMETTIFRVYELKSILAKQKYEMEKLSYEENKIKDSLVSCHRKDAKMWNVKLDEKQTEINNLSMAIEKTKMQLEFAIALQKKSENRKDQNYEKKEQIEKAENR